MGAFSMVVVEEHGMKGRTEAGRKIQQVHHVKDVLWYDDVADISLPVR